MEDAKALYEMGMKLCEMAKAMGYEEEEKEDEMEEEEEGEEGSSYSAPSGDKEARKKAIIMLATKGK